MNPQLHAYAVKTLLFERDELVKVLGQLKPGGERNELMREFWIVSGMLDHGIDSEVLDRCNKRHRMNGTMPIGYSYDVLMYHFAP